MKAQMRSHAVKIDYSSHEFPINFLFQFREINLILLFQQQQKWAQNHIIITSTAQRLRDSCFFLFCLEGGKKNPFQIPAFPSSK